MAGKHSGTKKSAPIGKVPAGPWYSVAWDMLTASEREHLEKMTRNGAPTPVTVDKPVSLLSAPSKMPGYSFGIAAGLTCPGMRTGEGQICEYCYAQKGSYAWLVTKRAYLVRMMYAKISVANPALRAAFIATLTAAIKRNVRDGDAYFRIHDSGDFYSPAYVDAWAAIIANLAHIKFWAPTRSWHIAESKGGRWAASFAALNALPNATIRPSALGIGDDAPVSPGFAAGSGVKRVDWNCPASTQNNECGSCRACWDTPAPIYYHLH